MKLFSFNQIRKNDKFINDNGWIFKSQFKGKLGYFSLKTPTMKEITYSKGPMVRYNKHLALGIGFITRSNKFCGVAFFDLHIRLLFCLAILFGSSYVSMKIYIGFIWSILFYILISFLSLEDDEKLLCRCQLIYEL